MHDGRFAAATLLDREPERAPHVLQPVPLPQVGAGEAAQPSARAGSGRPSSEASWSARSAAAIASE